MLRSESSCWADEVEAEEAETGTALPQPVDRTISEARHEPTSPVAPVVAFDRGESARGPRGNVDFRERGGRFGRGDRPGRGSGGSRERERFDGAGGYERRGGRGARGEDRGGLPPRRPKDVGWEPPAIPSEESRAARPRLKLKPRSEQAGAGDQATRGSSSIFGEAKPVDTTSRLAALDVRDSNPTSESKAETKKRGEDVELTKETKETKETKAKTGDAAARIGRHDDKTARPRAPKAPLVLKTTEHNPTKLDNPFDLLGEE